jgi:hypothetical protein
MRKVKTELRNPTHPGDEAAIRNMAKQFDVPVSLAREAYKQGDRNYAKAVDWLIKEVRRQHGINPSGLTATQRRWIAATLSNDEASTDDELVEYFKENGLTEAQAKAAVKQRSEHLRSLFNPAMHNPGEFHPTGDSVRDFNAAVRLMYPKLTRIGTHFGGVHIYFPGRKNGLYYSDGKEKIVPESKMISWIKAHSDPQEFSQTWYAKYRKNPATDAESAFESFHGEPSAETVVIEDELHEHEHLWTCGRLMELCVATLTGKYLELVWEDRKDADIPYLACSEDGAQLYIEGGDQELDLKAIGMDGDRWVKDRMVIGQFAPKEKGRAYNITYRTKKDFDNFEEIDYQHELGESSKELRNPAAPYLEYEPRNKKLYITGGQYIIKKPLFGTSPGIEN